jgi:septal ring factor EnvC (AmiA/AmiB activator)
VAGVWAAAATAIAVIALVEARKDEPDEGSSARVSAELDHVQSRLERRIDELQNRLGKLPTTDDVKRLESRLRTAEDDVRTASADARSARDKVSALDGRVQDLEQQQRTTTSP